MTHILCGVGIDMVTEAVFCAICVSFPPHVSSSEAHVCWLKSILIVLLGCTAVISSAVLLQASAEEELWQALNGVCMALQNERAKHAHDLMAAATQSQVQLHFSIATNISAAEGPMPNALLC